MRDLLVWHMLMIFCGALGALGSIYCKNVTYTKAVTGALIGICWFILFICAFQICSTVLGFEEARLEFSKFFNTIIN